MCTQKYACICLMQSMYVSRRRIDQHPHILTIQPQRFHLCPRVRQRPALTRDLKRRHPPGADQMHAPRVV